MYRQVFPLVSKYKDKWVKQTWCIWFKF